MLSVVIFGVLLCFWSGHLTVYEKPTHVIDLATGSFDWGNLGLTIYRLALGMAGSKVFYLLSKPVYVPIPHSYWVAPLLAVGELALCYNLVRLLRKTRVLRLPNKLRVFCNCPMISRSGIMHV